MDRMDLDVLHREAAKRARSINPSISDLRLAVDAAAEMQVGMQDARTPAAQPPDSWKLLLLPLDPWCVLLLSMGVCTPP